MSARNPGSCRRPLSFRDNERPRTPAVCQDQGAGPCHSPRRSVLERDQLGLPPAAKPLGSLLFLGPTGVGKTASALEFFAFPFRRNSLFRFDMSEAPSLNRNQPHCLPDWPLDPMPKLPRMTPSLLPRNHGERPERVSPRSSYPELERPTRETDYPQISKRCFQ